MDPVEILPEEICDDIFSHFNARDIKKASLVSKRWYNIIGQSKICMENLRIRTYHCLENFDSILRSKRQYQSLTIINDSSKMKENTKCLRITRKIVEKFSQSLRSIRISHDLKLKVDLPKLKMLEFSECYHGNVIVSNGLITKAKNLKKLKIDFYDLDKKSLQYIKGALLENENLKILDVVDCNIIQGLSYANLKLQLEEFHINPYRIMNKSTIKAFLSTQMSSLQIIGSPLIKDNIAYCMSNMPKLNTLILLDGHFPFYFYHLYYVGGETEELEYPTNRTITTLSFQTSLHHTDRSFLHAMAIITKTLNLREIKCSYLIPEILPHLYNCPSLEVVQYNGISYSFTQIQKDEMALHKRIKFVKIPIVQKSNFLENSKLKFNGFQWIYDHKQNYASYNNGKDKSINKKPT